jgi:hypothetical protein
MVEYLTYVVRRFLSSARRTVVLTAALSACAAALVGASTASAGIQQEFKAFSDCPLNAPELQLCVVSRVTSGEFVIGSKTVPINKTVTLQGGLSKTGQLIPAADGNTLSKTPLQLPGGLVGLEVLPPLTEVTATAELAGTATININNTFSGEGTAVSLPVVVKLDNPALGSACYIGTASEPLALNLTTGTTSPPPPNRPITGSPGQLSTPFAILRLTGVSLVDNAFAAPGVNGCGGLLSLVVDPAVDLDAGLPAAAGHNTAIMNGEVETAEPKNVRLEATLPELGRCAKVPFEKIEGERVYRGRFRESKCTTEDTGRLSAFEWYPGAEAKKFTGPTGPVTVEGHSGTKVTCKKGTSSGEYNGSKALAMTLKLVGCSGGSATEKCQSAGAAAGEIITGTLTGTLGFIQDDLNTEIGFITKVGVALRGQPSLLSAECGAAKTPVTVAGAVIGQLTPIDLMTKSFMLAFTQSGGTQSPEQFDGEPKQTLSLTSGNAGAEAAGFATNLKLNNEEKLAIKGEI